MIRTLLTTTALVTLLSGAAFAQDTPGASSLLGEGYSIVDTDGLASKLVGFPVYASAEDDAERLGEINDLVINQEGQVAAVIIGVGGFLGVGEKNVAVNYTDLKWVTAEDNTERLVLETTKEALNAAPDVELVEDDPADTAATAPAADQPAAEPATEMAATEQPANATDEDETALETGAITNEPAADQPNAMSPVDPFDPATATAIDVATLTADDLKGTNVYGPDNVHIGTVGDFVLSDDGKTVDAIIVDFGGFLGIGTKEVAVAYDNLTFYADPNNNRSLLLNINRKQMEQAPAFNRDTYSAERDAQRIVIDGAAS